MSVSKARQVYLYSTIQQQSDLKCFTETSNKKHDLKFKQKRKKLEKIDQIRAIKIRLKNRKTLYER